MPYWVMNDGETQAACISDSGNVICGVFKTSGSATWQVSRDPSTFVDMKNYPHCTGGVSKGGQEVAFIHNGQLIVGRYLNGGVWRPADITRLGGIGPVVKLVAAAPHDYPKFGQMATRGIHHLLGQELHQALRTAIGGVDVKPSIAGTQIHAVLSFDASNPVKNGPVKIREQEVVSEDKIKEHRRSYRAFYANPPWADAEKVIECRRKVFGDLQGITANDLNNAPFTCVSSKVSFLIDPINFVLVRPAGGANPAEVTLVNQADINLQHHERLVGDGSGSSPYLQRNSEKLELKQEYFVAQKKILELELQAKLASGADDILHSMKGNNFYCPGSLRPQVMAFKAKTYLELLKGHAQGGKRYFICVSNVAEEEAFNAAVTEVFGGSLPANIIMTKQSESRLAYELASQGRQVVAGVAGDYIAIGGNSVGSQRDQSNEEHWALITDMVSAQHFQAAPASEPQRYTAVTAPAAPVASTSAMPTAAASTPTPIFSEDEKSAIAALHKLINSIELQGKNMIRHQVVRDAEVALRKVFLDKITREPVNVIMQVKGITEKLRGAVELERARDSWNPHQPRDLTPLAVGQNVRVHKVSSSGNCMFAAIAKSLLPETSADELQSSIYDRLRLLIIDRIKIIKDIVINDLVAHSFNTATNEVKMKAKASLEGMTYEQIAEYYAQLHCFTDVEGKEEELTAAVQVIGRPIAVIDVRNNNSVTIIGELKDGVEPVVVKYTGRHYDAVEVRAGILSSITTAAIPVQHHYPAAPAASTSAMPPAAANPTIGLRRMNLPVAPMPPLSGREGTPQGAVRLPPIGFARGRQAQGPSPDVAGPLEARLSYIRVFEYRDFKTSSTNVFIKTNTQGQAQDIANMLANSKFSIVGGTGKPKYPGPHNMGEKLGGRIPGIILTQANIQQIAKLSDQCVPTSDHLQIFLETALCLEQEHGPRRGGGGTKNLK